MHRQLSIASELKRKTSSLKCSELNSLDNSPFEAEIWNAYSPENQYILAAAGGKYALLPFPM